MEQFAEAAGNGSGILRQPKAPLLLEPTLIRFHLQQALQPVFAHRENEAVQPRSITIAANARANDFSCPERGDNYFLSYDAALRLKQE